MLHQGIVRETVSYLEPKADLPALHSLPQWGTRNALDKARYPKQIGKDRLQPIQIVDATLPPGDSTLEFPINNPQQRIQYLERSIVFLRSQHQEVLSSLHAEIEKLRKENKGLQFRIIMHSRGQSKASDHDDKVDLDTWRPNSSDAAILDKMDASKETTEQTVYEEEISQLKYKLKDSENRCQYLAELVNNFEEELQREKVANRNIEQKNVTTSTSPVHVHSASGARPPTVEECHLLIAHLQKVTLNQQKEIEKLSGDLKSVFIAEKWDPAIPHAEMKAGLPRLPYLPNSTIQLPQQMYGGLSNEQISLPALQPRLGNQAVQRRKRTQILQRAKLRKDSKASY